MWHMNKTQKFVPLRNCIKMTKLIVCQMINVFDRMKHAKEGVEVVVLHCFFSFCYFVFWWWGQIQGLAHNKQVLYH